ncbi:mannose-6-phosphate isomerase, class I [Isoptericola sp. BMS4]|uniref:mannose-6-phosphate isomerase, class I n=1 Tax=Isoptericola sp. BMS4 TaxID=2527875 RepID=UPI0014231349|nr:mannose-6-phosphate isomerase, class I [Isoptericola sp. BMS4]
MPELYPLENTVQHYDWGSTTRLHDLLGTTPDGDPAAELWLGAHPNAPSRVAGPGATTPTSLLDLVRRAPEEMLGRRVADDYGPRLPYLLKVLAARRALSLQVHPRPHAARAGFNRENLLGLAPTDPRRSFHDDQHKPEMVVALTEFDGLAGFRTPRTVLDLLDDLDGPLVARVRDTLRSDRSSRGVREAFSRLVAARRAPGTPDAVATTVASVAARLADGSATARADATAVLLAEQHPGDPGAIASFLLNRVTLDPGEALFLPSGEVHAYLAGVGVEVMASSDNVLRAGLTTKRVDEEALVECASFVPRPPAVPEVRTTGDRGQVRTYRAPVAEFALTAADVEPGEEVDLPGAGPRIVLCLDGDVTVAASRCAAGAALRRGRSVFVPDAAGALRLSGTGHVVCAWVP